MNTIWSVDMSRVSGPKYQALMERLRDAIAQGQLKPGEQLPTVRDLAWRLGVTPGTVARAYALATQAGLTEAVVGRGTFVAGPSHSASQAAAEIARPPRPGVDDGPIDMRHPKVPDVGQEAAISMALRQVAERASSAWLYYPSQAGEAGLRREVVNWLSDLLLGPLVADDLVLTHGGQHSIGLVMRAVLHGERPVVGLEDLAYPGIRHAVRLARAEAISIPMDSNGMRADAFEQACRDHRLQMIYITPEAQNPTAVVMGLERRQEIVRIARAYDVVIVEDDCFSSMLSALPRFRALAPERSYYIGSLSKMVTPALRFGWALAPPGQVESLLLAMQQGQFGLSVILSELCLDLLASGAARRLADAALNEQAQRLDLMVNMLGGFDLTWQKGLPYTWLRLPRGWRPSTFARAAEAEGVLVRPSDEFAAINDLAPNAVRLAVPGQISVARFEHGLGVLARLLASPQGQLEV